MMKVEPGVLLADRYAVGEALGVGGTGVVWRAEDKVLRRQVAIKVVRNGEHERLAREARAAATVNSPNVVVVHDAGIHEEIVFLVMELVEGVDLAELLRSAGPLAPDVAALVGRDLARGLGAVHEAGIIHRDIKPSNVMLTADGDLKLADLGIARTSDATSTVKLTETGTIVGTIDYLAPEQLAEHDITPATDVYAVGLLVLECVTGTKPFGQGSLAERAARRLTRSPEPPPDVHQELRDAIVGAVEREPEDRPQNGHELARAFGLGVADEDHARAKLVDMVRRTLAVRADRVASGDATVAYTPTGVATPSLASGRTSGSLLGLDVGLPTAPKGPSTDELRSLGLQLAGAVTGVVLTVLVATSLVG